MRLTETQKNAIIDEATKDAAAFFEEFGESFDPDVSDWDATAFGLIENSDVPDTEEAFEVYTNHLQQETRFLTLKEGRRG
jgi:hypothetical protein